MLLHATRLHTQAEGVAHILTSLNKIFKTIATTTATRRHFEACAHFFLRLVRHVNAPFNEIVWQLATKSVKGKTKTKTQMQRSLLCKKKFEKFFKSFKVAKMQSDSLQKVSYQPRGSSACQSIAEIALAVSCVESCQRVGKV